MLVEHFLGFARTESEFFSRVRQLEKTTCGNVGQTKSGFRETDCPLECGDRHITGNITRGTGELFFRFNNGIEAASAETERIARNLC